MDRKDSHLNGEHVAQDEGKATRIKLFSIASPQMRTFHMTWVAFFVAFFGWFGIAPMMMLVRDDLGLTRTQVGNTIIASVAMTIVARLVIGWLCDRIGPRQAYSGLLILGSLPVMGIGLAQSYEAFLLFRLAIGVIGASFVITQYHTSVMFASNIVGTANATTAGWGNVGGGVTQIVMPLVLAVVLMLGVGEFFGWRVAMVVPGAAMLLVGVAYYFVTKDSPAGDFRKLRAEGRMQSGSTMKGSFMAAAKDRRVWALFVIYGACFGVELTMNNIIALYYHDRFELSIAAAGGIAGLFGLMNLFARTMGGILGDRAGIRFGLRGRVAFLGTVLLIGGVALIIFAQMSTMFMAVGAMVLFALFIQMSSGATFSVVPFINRKALGSVAGLVGAGGNSGAVAFGFLFRVESLSVSDALSYIGIAVILSSALVFLVRFSPATEARERNVINIALADRNAAIAGGAAD